MTLADKVYWFKEQWWDRFIIVTTKSMLVEKLQYNTVTDLVSTDEARRAE